MFTVAEQFWRIFATVSQRSRRHIFMATQALSKQHEKIIDVFGQTDLSRLFVKTLTEKTLEVPSARSELIKSLKFFAVVDGATAQIQVKAGEVFHFLLHKIDIQTLHDFLVEYAAVIKVQLPQPLNVMEGEKRRRGRPMSNGRNMLAEVIYGDQPILLKKKPGQKDTPAGRRITEAIHAYQVSIGEKAERKIQLWPKKVPSSARTMLIQMWMVCDARRLEVLQGIIEDAFGVGASKQLRRLLGASDVEEMA
jgi:hypothetical protein